MTEHNLQLKKFLAHFFFGCLYEKQENNKLWVVIETKPVGQRGPNHFTYNSLCTFPLLSGHLSHIQFSRRRELTINCQKQAQVEEGMVIAALPKYWLKKDDHRKKGRSHCVWHYISLYCNEKSLVVYDPFLQMPLHITPILLCSAKNSTKK